MVCHLYLPYISTFQQSPGTSLCNIEMTTNFSASPYQACIDGLWVSFIDHKHTFIVFIQLLL